MLALSCGVNQQTSGVLCGPDAVQTAAERCENALSLKSCIASFVIGSGGNRMTSRFYTYLYLRDDGTPYYVGKGKLRRAFSRDRFIHRPGSEARIFIQFWSSEEEAFEIEKYYIRLFGRKNKGTGILRNLTDGGEGTSGRVVLDAEREIHRNTGRIHGPRIGKIGGKLGGRTQGRINATNGHLTRISKLTDPRARGRKGGPIGGASKSFAKLYALSQNRPPAGFSVHCRWHVRRGIIKPDCRFCKEEKC
jgi:hypothetical protein